MVRHFDRWLFLVLGFAAAPEHGRRPRRRGAARRRHEPLLRLLVLQGPVQLPALLRRWLKEKGGGEVIGGGMGEAKLWLSFRGGRREESLVLGSWEGVEFGLAGVPGPGVW